MATLSPLLASLTLQGQPRCSAASSSRASLRGSSVRASACVRAGRPRTGLCALAAQEAAETEPEAAPRGARGKRDSGPPAKRGPRGAPREKSEFEERVVQVARVTKVTKGGKMLAFRAVVVVGNKAGKVGVGVAKAKEVIIAVQKAVTDAKKTLSTVPITANSSVPHKLTQQGNGSCNVMIRPALPGSGITAGGSVRAVLEMAGYKNVNAKMLAGSNPLNNGRAALEALRAMRTAEQVARQRGLTT